MKILGQSSTNGEFTPYVKPIEVKEFGKTLRDEEGMVWAVRDEYGDWVSPNLKRIGIKSKMVIEKEGEK